MAGSAVELKRKILDKIEVEMKKNGMSQGELGRQLGVKRTDINRYLRGTNTAVSLERIIEMAETVGLEIDVTIKKKKG
ncbi:MAG: helix-turn-helix transcriptional regulator [Pseudobdellovibrionaceae bacterium]|nr:MAG: helix-turn-helix transcriptional regulator [Pseudobdellovibrionaceae bacterium]